MQNSETTNLFIATRYVDNWVSGETSSVVVAFDDDLNDLIDSVLSCGCIDSELIEDDGENIFRVWLKDTDDGQTWIDIR